MNIISSLLRHKVGLISVLALFACCTFSLLWMRKQVYLQSQFGNELERRLEKLSRQMHRLNVKIASFHSSNFLVGKCAQNMTQPTNKQTIWVSDSYTLLGHINNKFKTVASNN